MRKPADRLSMMTIKVTSTQAGFKAWLKALVEWTPHIKQAKRQVTAWETGARGWSQIWDVWTVL